MLSNKLIDELGLLRLVPKQQAQTVTEAEPVSPTQPQQLKSETQPQLSQKLDKNEFRLLVKMLQAIDHDCQYDHIEYDGSVVKYQLANKTLVFHDLNVTDGEDIINLASLSDLIAEPALKRPVWEKLKRLK